VALTLRAFKDDKEKLFYRNGDYEGIRKSLQRGKGGSQETKGKKEKDSHWDRANSLTLRGESARLDKTNVKVIFRDRGKLKVGKRGKRAEMAITDPGHLQQPKKEGA